MLALITAILMGGSGQPQIDIRPGPVAVSSRFVRLEEIAEVKGAGERFRRIIVLTLEGPSAFITKDALRDRLSARGISADISGPSYVQVRLKGVSDRAGCEEATDGAKHDKTEDIEALRLAALSGIEKRSANIHLRLDTINSWGDNGPVEAGNLRDFRIEASGGGSGMRWARFGARDAGGARVHGWARFVVEEKFNAVAAKAPLRRGELLTDGKVELKEITLPFGRFDGFESLETVVGRHAARDVRAGAVLRTADVKRQLMVRKGTILTASFDGPGFQLSDRVVAMKDAEEGEVVRVKNCRSGKVFRARVITQDSVVPVE